MANTNQPKKAPRLHQLLAVGKSIKSSALSELESAYHKAQKPNLFHGQERTYSPEIDGGMKLPDEKQIVQETVGRIISKVKETAIRDFDLTLQRDRTNQIAKGSVIIDGRTIIEDAPVSFLLSMEQQLLKIRNFIAALPTPDTGEQWTLNANTNMLESAPKISLRTAKEQHFISVAAATEKHAEQIREVTRDNVVGRWTTRLISGALTSTSKEKMLVQIDKAMEAFKFAREEANSTEAVAKEESGSKLFDYIFAM